MSALSRHGSFQQTWKSYIAAAQWCTTARKIKTTHALFITHGLHHNTYAVSKLLAAFFSLPDLDKNLPYASLIFDSIESRNTFVYNTLIRIYSRSTHPHLGLDYFRLMLEEDCGFVVPDNLTFHFVLISCVKASLFFTGRQIHGWVVKNSILLSDGHIQTGLIRLYVEGKVLRDARKMFDEITNPDAVKWNVLINGYLRCGLGSEALRVFREMLVCGAEPDEFCVTTALTACAQTGALVQGKWIHEYVKKRDGFESDLFIGTALVDVYTKCGCIDMAVEVFEGMSKRNRFLWAAMIGGFAVHGFAKRAIDCLETMELEDGIKPDHVVLLGVLAACTHGGLLEEGRSLLDNMEAKYGIVPKHEHYSCVVDLLCRAGRLDEAFELIKRMPMKPLASVWGALLNSCRIHKNVELAELAVNNLLEIERGNADEEEAALVQLSNVYLSVHRCEDASKIRQMIGDRGLSKTPGCSVLEVDGKVNEFVSGDSSHPNLSQIHAMLELLLSAGSLHKLETS